MTPAVFEHRVASGARRICNAAKDLATDCPTEVINMWSTGFAKFCTPLMYVAEAHVENHVFPQDVRTWRLAFYTRVFPQDVRTWRLAFYTL